MDTVKVSIDKLQILNDRITETIGALEAVRGSVHALERAQFDRKAGLVLGGLSHSTAPIGIDPRAFVGLGVDPVLGADARLQRFNATFPYLTQNVTPGC